MRPRAFPSRFLTALGCAALLLGCDRRPPTAPQKPEPSTTAIYQSRGVIQHVDPPQRKAVIAHETIPGFMEAMTMEFTSVGSGDLEGLSPGDVITFRLQVGEKRSWIDQCRKTGERQELPEVPASLPKNAGLQIGDPLPDCVLVDERGQPRTVREFRGQVLALTFFFTRCPLPDFCPLLSHRFAATDRSLATDQPYHFLSISFDPEHDTPEVLAAYATRFRPASDRWTFVTGSVEAVQSFAAQCGVAIAARGGQIDHNLRTLVIDRDGRVRQIFTGNQWTAQALAEAMQQAAQGPLPPP